MLDKNKKKKEDFEEELLVVKEVGEESSFKNTDIEKLKKELSKCKKEKQEYLDGWQRSKADFINARKEDEKYRKELKQYASEDIISQFIPVIDSFDMAFSNKDAWNNVDSNWRAGIEHIYSQILGIFKDNGIEKIMAEGVIFDPTLHESVDKIEVKEKDKDGIILEVVQNGYTLNGNIIRASRVKVGVYKK